MSILFENIRLLTFRWLGAVPGRKIPLICSPGLPLVTRNTSITTPSTLRFTHLASISLGQIQFTITTPALNGLQVACLIRRSVPADTRMAGATVSYREMLVPTLSFLLGSFRLDTRSKLHVSCRLTRRTPTILSEAITAQQREMYSVKVAGMMLWVERKIFSVSKASQSRIPEAQPMLQSKCRVLLICSQLQVVWVTGLTNVLRRRITGHFSDRSTEIRGMSWTRKHSRHRSLSEQLNGSRLPCPISPHTVISES